MELTLKQDRHPWQSGEENMEAQKLWLRSFEAMNEALKSSGIRMIQPDRMDDTDDGVMCFYKNIPEEYKSFEDYASEKRYEKDGKKAVVRFADFSAIIEAAWKLVKLEAVMWKEGMFYLGDLRKNIYFHVQTGNLLFLDIYGMKRVTEPLTEKELYQEYRAPELILKKTEEYSEATELWTLAVMLYELFFHSGSPMRGAASMRQTFLDEREEYLWMAEHGVFTMEEDSCVNHPVHGVHDRLIKYWGMYPRELGEAFTKAFTDGKEPEKRMDIRKWQEVLNRLKTDYLSCSCGYKGFAESFQKTANGNYRCPRCGENYYVFECEDSRIYLSSGAKIFRWQIDGEDTENNTVVGRVVENKQKKGLFGIKNMTSLPWTGKNPDGTERQIAPGGGIPLWRGLEICFDGKNIWKIREDRSNG